MPHVDEAVLGEERTGAQHIAIGNFGRQQLDIPLPKSPDTYRTIRRHPTVALARALTIAPVVAAGWSVESDDDVSDEWVELIQELYGPLHQHVVDNAMRGGIDFGWQGFEQVWDIVDGRFVLKKLKPLLNDLTEIIVDGHTGAIVAYEQQSPDHVLLPVEQLLHIGFRVEGTGWYGESLLENIRLQYNNWINSNDVADRYDERVAGAYMILHYPRGQSDFGGTETSNAAIAKDIYDNLGGGARMIFPRPSRQDVAEAGEGNKAGWELEYVSDPSAKQLSFVARLQYLDKLLVRGLLMPERAILEGEHGTKAETAEQTDLAITNLELQHIMITTLTNWHSVNRVLTQNFGPKAANTVRLVAAPIQDENRAVLKDVYAEILKNPTGAMEEMGKIDTDQIKDQLGVPKSAEVAQFGETGDPEPAIPEGLSRKRIADLERLNVGGNGQ